MIRLFDHPEFATRVARTKQRMAQEEIDVLLVASPANQFYLTGYDGWSFYTPQMVVVSLDADEPIWFGRQMDAAGARLTVYMREENIVAYPDHYVASDERHPMQLLVDLLKQKRWESRRVGVEMDEYYYTARWHEVLTEGLPDATFVDAFLLVNWVRMIKSAREIDYLMDAGRIASAAMQAAIDTAGAGVRQCDVMAELYRVTTGGTPDIGGTFTCKPPNAMVGELSSAPHLSWTDAPLAPGDMFYIEMGGCRHRYHAPLSRCVFIGTPPEGVTALATIIAEGLDAVLDAVRPGMVCEEVETVWRRTVAKHGIHRDARLGYPVGIGYPPTWGELTCSFRQGDQTVLEPNMTFHAIPALWLDDYGVVISESFVITEGGAQPFAMFPRRLFSK